MDQLVEYHRIIEETNVVERYLMGKLSATEKERFEVHYLDCDACLEKLELSKRLYQGLRDVAAEEVPKAVTQAAVAQTTILAWLLQRGRAFQTATILGVLSLIIVPWALLMPSMAHLRGEQKRLNGALAAAFAPQAQTPVYRLSPERSGGGETPSTRVSLGANPEWVVLSLQLPPRQRASSYRVRLLATGGDVRWQGGPLESDTSGQVTLHVHASWFEVDTYHLELIPADTQAAAAPVARYAFGVRRSEP